MSGAGERRRYCNCRIILIIRKETAMSFPKISYGAPVHQAPNVKEAMIVMGKD